MDSIKKRIHELYWEDDINCARTMLICLSELFEANIEKQTLNAAVGLHGAGGYRAQCGLVEGGLMFIGIYFSQKQVPEEQIVSSCYDFAEKFESEFGSLGCFTLRPLGFTAENPPHLCENLTVDVVKFTYEYISNEVVRVSFPAGEQ